MLRTFGICFVLLLLRVAPASTWGFGEHWQLGAEAYAAACARLQAELDSYGPVVRERVELACDAVGAPGDATLSFGEFYAQGCALAGDHLKEPEEFSADITGRRAASVSRFLRQAVVNRRHFHPDVTDEWLRYHEQALEIVTGGAAGKGLPGVSDIRRLQAALQHQAFADHFLQDAFAAGHLGFNRAATSNAPARSFHNSWNRWGRMVENSLGESWVAFGDGCLNAGSGERREVLPRDGCGRRDHRRQERPEALASRLLVEARRQVARASEQSVYSLLLAFATGERQPEAERRAWDLLPVRAQAHFPGFYSLKQLFRPRAAIPQPRGMVSLREINRPAIVTFALESWWIQDSSRPDGGTNSGTLIGYTQDYPLHFDLWEGLQTFSLRFYFGFGRFPWDGGDTTTVMDFGLGLRLGSTTSGILSHEVLFGSTGPFDWSSEPLPVRHLDYRLDVELGKLFLRLQAGPAWRSEGGSGVFLAVGIGWVLSTRGGGPLTRAH